MSCDDRISANQSYSGDNLRGLIERFAALDPEQRRRQIEIAIAIFARTKGEPNLECEAVGPGISRLPMLLD